MLMLAVDAVIGYARGDLPPHMGGVLHGFVERALLNHANHLIPVLRPDGDDEYASLAIEPPPYGRHAEGRLRFGIILFRDATQSWNLIARTLVEQTPNGINNRAVKIESAWMYQPGSPVQEAILDGRMVDPPPWPESPAAWIRRANAKTPLENSHARVHSLEFRSPLLVGSRGSIRRNQRVPWPTLKTLLDSIAKRMLVLEPELGQSIGIAHGWRASERYEQVKPLTPVETPATQIQWQYSVHRSICKPGIVGRLIYAAELGPVELALLEWGQWLGIGQQTTMGCGRYVWHPGPSPKS